MEITHETILRDLMRTVSGCVSIMRLWCADQEDSVPEPDGVSAIHVVRDALDAAMVRAMELEEAVDTRAQLQQNEQVNSVSAGALDNGAR